MKLIANNFTGTLQDGRVYKLLCNNNTSQKYLAVELYCKNIFDQWVLQELIGWYYNEIGFKVLLEDLLTKVEQKWGLQLIKRKLIKPVNHENRYKKSNQ